MTPFCRSAAPRRVKSLLRRSERQRTTLAVGLQPEIFCVRTGTLASPSRTPAAACKDLAVVVGLSDRTRRRRDHSRNLRRPRPCPPRTPRPNPPACRRKTRHRTLIDLPRRPHNIDKRPYPPNSELKKHLQADKADISMKKFIRITRSARLAWPHNRPETTVGAPLVGALP